MKKQTLNQPQLININLDEQAQPKHEATSELHLNGTIVEPSKDLQVGGFDAVLAVIPVVDPTDVLVGSQILVTKPLLQGSEVLPKSGAIESTLANYLLKNLLPRFGGSTFHQLSARRLGKTKLL